MAGPAGGGCNQLLLGVTQASPVAAILAPLADCRAQRTLQVWTQHPHNKRRSGTPLAPSPAGNYRTVLICRMIPTLDGNRVVYNGIGAATKTHHGLRRQDTGNRALYTHLALVRHSLMDTSNNTVTRARIHYIGGKTTTKTLLARQLIVSTEAHKLGR
jgi:hypothetical protein